MDRTELCISNCGTATAPSPRVRTHTFDALGRLTAYADTLTQQTIEWQCDPPQDPDGEPECGFRPVQWTPQALAAQSYSYDASGNRTDLGAAVPATSNRVSDFAGYKLLYDADGNLTRRYLIADTLAFNQRLTWNSLGELVAVTTTRDSVSTSASYGYDAAGMRIRKTVDGVTTRFVHRGDHLLMEVDAAGEVVRHYDYLPGADNPYVVLVRVPGSGYAAYFYRSEAPGHVVGLVNTSGLVGEYRYDPWGKPTYASEPIYQPFRFAGREYDEESGLYYNRARYYDPELGRFVSEDPIGLTGGMNPYTYAANDPVNLRDPTGLCPDPYAWYEATGGVVGCPRDDDDSWYDDLTTSPDEWAARDGAGRYRMTPYEEALANGDLRPASGELSSPPLAADPVFHIASYISAARGLFAALFSRRAPLITAQRLASEVAGATGGQLSRLGHGYKIAIPNGRREIVIRVMEQGGGRTNYWRASIPGKETFMIDGTASVIPELIHHQITSNSYRDILRIVNRIQGRP
jgi:RHS repeat-associated protein